MKEIIHLFVDGSLAFAAGILTAYLLSALSET